ncbi:MAG: hypothetical protein Q4F78_08515 [Bacillota bacterium]|nr:hypothetical protein [Bacillota bacterium]
MSPKKQRKLKTHQGNYILIGPKEYSKKQAVEIVRKEATLHPDIFEGEEPYFFFELRYFTPFDKSFKELKRLQGIAANNAGRRDEYRGYVVIDLNNYLTHENEHYFDISMYFLADMSDCWKYIFLVGDTNDRAAKMLIRRMFSILLPSFFCEVRDINITALGEKRVDEICAEQGVRCTEHVKNFLHEVLAIDKNGAVIVDALLRDISLHLGSDIEMIDLVPFCKSNSTVVKYMLSDKQYDRFMKILEHNKESSHEEREAV